MFRNTTVQKLQPATDKTSIRGAWAAAMDNRIFRLKVFLTPGLFIIYSAVTQRIADYVELRNGVKLDDKLLSYLPVIDCSVPVFFLLYSSMLMIVAANLAKPKIVMRLLEMHFIVALVRQLCILMIPLEPPVGMVVLRDIFLDNTIYPHHVPMTKDLFFSGHVASILIYFLCAEQRYMKIYLGLATVAMSFMVLSMRVHYSYDVYGAIVLTSVIYTANARLRKSIEKNAAYAEPIRVSI